MSGFLKLAAKAQAVVDAFFEATQKADENRQRETFSAIQMQKTFRGHRSRQRIRKWRRACIAIQRVFRGHLGRERCHQARKDRALKEEREFFHHCAVVIQKIFRGFYSRRHHHDFYARKAYLATILSKSEQVRQEVHTFHQQQKAELRDKQHQEFQERVNQLTSNMHHLISTKISAGVYNSPYVDPQERVTVHDGVFIEDHIRKSTAANLANSSVLSSKKFSSAASTSSFLSSSSNGEHHAGSPSLHSSSPTPVASMPSYKPMSLRPTRVLPLSETLSKTRAQGPFKPAEVVEQIKTKQPALTLQASSRFGVDVERSRFEEKINRMTQLASQDFLYKKSKVEPHKSGITVNTPYPEKFILREENKDLRIPTRQIYSSAVHADGMFEESAIPFVSFAAPTRRIPLQREQSR